MKFIVFSFITLSCLARTNCSKNVDGSAESELNLFKNENKKSERSEVNFTDPTRPQFSASEKDDQRATNALVANGL